MVIFISPYSYSITMYYASMLGCAATLPVIDPNGTVLVLDVNYTISESCPLVLTGNGGNLTITATGNQQLIIATSAQWNIASLLQPHALNVTGNAQLVMMPGAQLLADQATGVNINFQDQTLLSVQP